MKRATKCGMMLSAADSLVVCVLVAAGLLASDSLPIPFSLVVAVDLPAILLWVLWLESMGHPGLPEGLLIFLLYGVIGGAWWYLIGWLGVTVHSRLAGSSRRTRFVSGLLIAVTLVVLVLAIQFIALIAELANDGCTSAGFPVPFFRGCCAVLYWPAVRISHGALIFDGAVWLILALAFSFWLSRRSWQGK